MATRITFGDSIYYGWYVYLEDGELVIGTQNRCGKELYRGEYKGDDTPYLNEIKEHYAKAYHKIIRYFENAGKR